ncbi:MAG: VTT domain-containing protein [Candidatus Wallbacteria bacterium]|nr:VTT domain-containing protein [Candidatus Wallbacteria bacterium]
MPTNTPAVASPGRGATVRFWALAALVVVSAVAGMAELSGRRVGDPSAIRAAVQAYGAWAPAIYVAVLALRPFLFLPSAPLMMAGGLAFGAGLGTLLTTLGLTLAALTTYGLARLMGHEFVRARMGPRLDELASSGLGPGAVLVLNMLPVTPLSIPNYGAGLAAMPIGAFLAATAGGLTPRVLAWSTMGSVLVRFDLPLLLASCLLLVALLARPLASPTLRARFRELTKRGS